MLLLARESGLARAAMVGHLKPLAEIPDFWPRRSGLGALFRDAPAGPVLVGSPEGVVALDERLAELGAGALMGLPLPEGRGLLCVLDVRSRRWSNREVHAIAAMVAVAFDAAGADRAVRAPVESRSARARRTTASRGTRPLDPPELRASGAASETAEHMLDRIQDGIVGLDAQWHYTFVNRRAGELLGREPASLIGRHIWTEFPEGRGQPFHLAYERAMREQQPLVIEEHYQPWDRWFENWIYPSADGLTIYFHEITSRKLAELALRESEQRFRALAENMTDVVFLLDPSSMRPVFLNPAYERVFEADAQDLAEDPRAWARRVHPDDRDRVLERFQEFGRGAFREVEYRLRRPDGAEVWIRTRVFPVAGPDGSLLHLAGISEDITERKRTDEALRLLNSQLEDRVRERTRSLQEANEQLEAYSYTISHDLRAPMRGVHGFAIALREDCGPALGEGGRAYLDRIVNSVERMESLIRDLLTYSRMGREELRLGPVSLRAVLADVHRELEAECARRGAVLIVSDHLPDVVGHHPLLVQAVINLLSNAMKFVDEGTRPRVEIDAERRGDCVRLWVRDNGIGIAPELLDRVFHVFERLHGIEAYPGTGVGLAIVRRSIERMGGRCGVESQVGRGSRFWLELPHAG